MKLFKKLSIVVALAAVIPAYADEYKDTLNILREKNIITQKEYESKLNAYEEKEWATYLFKLGPVIGLNANILRDFVDYTAVDALKQIGIKYNNPAPRSTPIPWFNKHSDTSKKQTALQESESTNYVIGVMGEGIDYDALPAL